MAALTTSATFGQGKVSLIRKIKQFKEVEMILRLLMDEDVTSEQVGEAAIRIIVILSGGKKSDSLKNLRHAKYMEMVASAKNIDPQNSLLQQELLITIACVCTCNLYFGRNLLSASALSTRVEARWFNTTTSHDRP